MDGRNCCKKVAWSRLSSLYYRTSVGAYERACTLVHVQATLPYIFKRCAWFLSPASSAVSANNQLTVLFARQLGRTRLVLYTCDRVLDWDREKAGKRVSITAKIRDLGLGNYNPVTDNLQMITFVGLL